MFSPIGKCGFLILEIGTITERGSISLISVSFTSPAENFTRKLFKIVDNLIEKILILF